MVLGMCCSHLPELVLLPKRRGIIWISTCLQTVAVLVSRVVLPVEESCSNMFYWQWRVDRPAKEFIRFLPTALTSPHLAHSLLVTSPHFTHS